MVVSHDKVTMTTFVMPNSYCIDGDYDFDGESLGDWHTGSGAVLMKNIIKCGFGIEPQMNDVKVIPANYIPADNAEITLQVGTDNVTVKYENCNSGERKFYLDGKELVSSFDQIRNTPFVVVSKKDLHDGCVILIKD
jgi:cellobiose phosphorylase